MKSRAFMYVLATTGLLVLFACGFAQGQTPSLTDGKAPKDGLAAPKVVMYRIKEMTAAWVAKKLTRSMGKRSDVYIEILEETNTLLIRANDETIRQVIPILKQIEDNAPRLFCLQLKNGDAILVGNVLRLMAAYPPLSGDDSLRIVTDSRTNSIILYCERPSCKLIQFILAGSGILQ